MKAPAGLPACRSARLRTEPAERSSEVEPDAAQREAVNLTVSAWQCHHRSTIVRRSFADISTRTRTLEFSPVWREDVALVAEHVHASSRAEPSCLAGRGHCAWWRALGLRLRGL